MDSLLRKMEEFETKYVKAKPEGGQIIRVVIHDGPDGNIRDTSKTPHVTSICLDCGTARFMAMLAKNESWISLSLSDYINQTDIYGDQVPHFLKPDPAYGNGPTVKLF